ncbi:MAG TPA: hypothetical protein VK859_06225, partial [bacterium]|nr:hypothetical protein [bacterium]
MKQMNFGNIFAFAIPLALFVGWGMVGCNKSAQAPVAPLRSEVLSVSLPLSPEVKSSFLGYPSNNLLYKLTAPGLSPVMGSYVPSSASVSFGSV